MPSMNRKGISPLIAAVLLIAFTMTIAAILATWAQTFGEEQLGEAGERGTEAIECPQLNVDIESASWDDTGGLDALIRNRMRVNVTNIRFEVYSDGSPTVFEPDEFDPIGPVDVRQISADNELETDEVPERLELYVDWERCPGVQPIDFCEGFDGTNFLC